MTLYADLCYSQPKFIKSKKIYLGYENDDFIAESTL